MSPGRGQRLKNVNAPTDWQLTIPYILRYDIFFGFSAASLFSTFYLRWIVLGQPPLQWRVEDKPNHLKQIQERVTPLKNNTKPTNHPIEKETHLPNIYIFWGFHINFPGCKPWNLVTAGGTELAFFCAGRLHLLYSTLDHCGKKLAEWITRESDSYTAAGVWSWSFQFDTRLC